MTKKLFIGNLSFSLTEDQLKEIFAPFGEIVSFNLVMDKFSGRSKGFGFVEYDNEESAQKALQSLDGSEQDGRNIAVKEALPRTENPTN
jgi:RNA recognition motif-containing protein